MPQIQIDDIRLFYSDEGSGAPVLLVHAFPLSGAMWQPQLAALAPGRRVIAPDLRGFGRSELGQREVTLDRYADDLAVLLDHLGLERVTLAGLSMGGYIAFAFVRRYPERVGRLILADTRAEADTEQGRAGREANASLVEAQGAAALAEKLLPGLLSPGATGTVRDQVRRLMTANHAPGIAAALRAMANRPASTELLREITAPTLVIVGSEDSLTPPAAAAAMHAALPLSEYIVIDGAGHLANLEAPEAFNAAVLAFLGG